MDRVAETEILLALNNTSSAAEEAVLLVPVPDGASVKSFSYWTGVDQAGGVQSITNGGPATAARVLAADEARTMYETIVRNARDPGLLEFAGYRFIRSSVFPVPTGGMLKVKICYEQILEADGDRIDYILPRSETADLGAQWTITAQLQSAREIKMVYSPSHKLKLTKSGPNTTIVEIHDEDKRESGAFQLCILSAAENNKNRPSASFLTYPDGTAGGGYFLLIASPPAEDVSPKEKQDREVTVVIDRSGSMAGTKMAQAIEAARQVLEGLAEGEYFNIMDYSGSVERFAPSPIIKNKESMSAARDYLTRIQASGGTNIHEALLAALGQTAAPGAMPLVLFLTDGIPTNGMTRESDIRDAARISNIWERRIFTFGVGNDVNAPLLDSLANSARGYSTYVRPEENVEIKVGQVFKKLQSPLLGKPVLAVLDENNNISTRRTRDVLPSEIPDIFVGGELVILGKYYNNDPIHFRLSGESNGKNKQFDFVFSPVQGAKSSISSMTHSFIPRLWAARKIGALVDEVRLSTDGSNATKKLPDNPRMKEAVDEIIALSARFGVLSEYTAFFANEPVDLSQTDKLHSRLRNILADRAAAERTGQGSIAQSVNIGRQRRQNAANHNNTFLDGQLREVRIKNIQQKSDRALFRRGVTWVDSEVFALRTGKSADDPPDLIIQFGSPQYFELARQLTNEGRSSVLATNGRLLLFSGGKRILVNEPK